MLRTVNDDIEKLFRPLADENNITMIQMRLLLELQGEKEHTIGSLAKAVSLTGGNASAMCKRLEKEGFLERVRDRLDERVVNLRLTGKGVQTVAGVETFLMNRYQNFLLQKNPKDFNAIYDGLQKLTQLLQELRRLSGDDTAEPA